MRIYWINDFEKGNLGMMARPRGNDWLQDEVTRLKLLNVNIVISLLEYNEVMELEIEKESEICQASNIDFISFPIKDRGVPVNRDGYIELVKKIDRELKKDSKIVIHCRMGIGRTSMLAAGVVIKNKIADVDVFEFLSKRRKLSVPDTEEQKLWVLGLKNKF